MSTKTELVPFTNFIGPEGNTFCSEGKGVNEKLGYVQSCLAYSPGGPEATRVRFTNGTRHIKNHFDGGRLDKPASPALYPLLKDLYTTDLQTGQRIVAVPLTDVQTFFNPHDSLDFILHSRSRSVPESVKERVFRATDFFIRAGMRFNDMGLYGGLQSFITHQTYEPNDIDISFYGFEYYELLTQMLIQNKMEQPQPTDIDAKLRHRRTLPNSFFFPDGFNIDIKIIPKAEDVLSYRYDLTAQADIQRITGIVTDAREGMTFPTSFGIDTPNGRVIVSSTLYTFLNALTEGDHVNLVAHTTEDPRCFFYTDTDQERIQVFFNEKI